MIQVTWSEADSFKRNKGGAPDTPAVARLTAEALVRLMGDQFTKLRVGAEYVPVHQPPEADVSKYRWTARAQLKNSGLSSVVMVEAWPGSLTDGHVTAQVIAGDLAEGLFKKLDPEIAGVVTALQRMPGEGEDQAFFLHIDFVRYGTQDVEAIKRMYDGLFLPTAKGEDLQRIGRLLGLEPEEVSDGDNQRGIERARAGDLATEHGLRHSGNGDGSHG